MHIYTFDFAFILNIELVNIVRPYLSKLIFIGVNASTFHLLKAYVLNITESLTLTELSFILKLVF